MGAVRSFTGLRTVARDTDPNAVIDEGTSKITRGMESAALLCDVMGFQYAVGPPTVVCYQGWGQACSILQLVKCTWILDTIDSESNPVSFEFDLTDGNSPLILGIYFLQYFDTCNIRASRVIRFKRQSDGGTRTMPTHIAPDQTGNIRLPLEVVPHANNSYRSLLASHFHHDLMAVASKIHEFSHV